MAGACSTMPFMNASAQRPDPSEYAPGFHKYVQLAPGDDIVEALEAQLGEALRRLSVLSDEAALTLHAPYTWTIKQVVGHITDCERVFAHRALWIARHGGTPLASFDETGFMEATEFNRWPLAELLAEFEHVRRSSVLFFRHLEPEAWVRRGVVADHPATARAFAYVIAGHAQHHLDIVRRRLLEVTPHA
jgi:hypothetical protein